MNTGAGVKAAGTHAVAPQSGAGIAVSEIILRHLNSRAAIAKVLHLRDEIDLSAYAADVEFEWFEKKEIKSAWFLDLNINRNLLGRFELCQ